MFFVYDYVLDGVEYEDEWVRAPEDWSLDDDPWEAFVKTARQIKKRCCLRRGARVSCIRAYNDRLFRTAYTGWEKDRNGPGLHPCGRDLQMPRHKAALMKRKGFPINDFCDGVIKAR